jgi:hypothetical protein
MLERGLCSVLGINDPNACKWATVMIDRRLVGATAENICFQVEAEIQKRDTKKDSGEEQ